VGTALRHVRVNIVAMHKQ